MAGPVANLRSLDSANFKTSKRADAVNDLMKVEARVAASLRTRPSRHRTFAGAVRTGTSVVRRRREESGKTIYGRNLFGDEDLPLWVAMIVEKGDLLNPQSRTFKSKYAVTGIGASCSCKRNGKTATACTSGSSFTSPNAPGCPPTATKNHDGR